MKITSLNADGSGTATLAINFVGHFEIQISQNGQVMNLVEIEDTINYDVGVAVKQ
jgi:predicted aspartyl protease